VCDDCDQKGTIYSDNRESLALIILFGKVRHTGSHSFKFIVLYLALFRYTEELARKSKGSVVVCSH